MYCGFHFLSKLFDWERIKIQTNYEIGTDYGVAVIVYKQDKLINPIWGSSMRNVKT